VSGVSEAEWERIERLIEQSSLGTPEAKAARESVAPEIGTALALAARYLGERDDALAWLAEVQRVLEDEPMFVSGIRRAIEKNTDGYGRGGEITHTPRPGRRGSGTCPADNLTDWLDALHTILDAPALDDSEWKTSASGPHLTSNSAVSCTRQDEEAPEVWTRADAPARDEGDPS